MTAAPQNSESNHESHRTLVIITIMLVAILEVLDSTIVNVALGPMMGGLGASSDQITWVLTSYIVSSAIFMPLTGFFDNRLGRKNFLILAIIGFMTSSMICGLTSSLQVMIAFRVTQGMFGAALVPLSQSILKQTFPPEQQNKAMAIWGIGIMAAPVLGPTIGGYIVEHASWRWIFYLNLPVCLVALSLSFFVIKPTEIKKAPIDWLGLFLMATGIGCLQMFLDRGNQEGWLSSNQIVLLLLISCISLGWFILRGITKKDNIVNLKLFADRNFAVSTIMLALICAALFSTIALQPIMLEQLMGYPAITTGLVMAPRGIAVAVAMAFVPSLMRYLGVKPLLIIGLLFSAYGTYEMSELSLMANFFEMTWPGIIQGVGVGLVMVPLAVTSLITIPDAYTSEASGLFNYGRMLGSSIGISVLSTIITRQTQINWHQLGAHVQRFNTNLQIWLNAHHLNINSPLAHYELAHSVSRQANMIAYIDGYWAIAIVLIALVPLVFCLGKVDSGKMVVRGE